MRIIFTLVTWIIATIVGFASGQMLLVSMIWLIYIIVFCIIARD